MGRDDDGERGGSEDGKARERLRAVEVRLDRADADITELRRSKHSHGNTLTEHEGKIGALEDSVKAAAANATAALGLAGDANRGVVAIKEILATAERRRDTRTALIVALVVAAINLVAKYLPSG